MSGVARLSLVSQRGHVCIAVLSLLLMAGCGKGGSSIPAASISRQVTWTVNSCNWNAPKGQFTSCTITVTGSIGGPNQVRQFNLWVGTNYSAGGAVLIYYHGALGGPAECNLARSDGTGPGWSPRADAYGFILICPQGWPVNGVSGQNNWYSYYKDYGVSGDPNWTTNIPDDGAFTRAIIQAVIASPLAPNSKRIYTTGYSAGAALQSRLLIEDGSVIAASAIVEGMIAGNDQVSPPPASGPRPISVSQYPVSLIEIRASHGDRFTGGGAPQCGNYVDMANTDETIGWFRASNQCSSTTPNTNLFCPVTNGGITSQSACTASFYPWASGSGRDCRESAEVYKHLDNCMGLAGSTSSYPVLREYPLIGGAHQWYGGIDISKPAGSIYNSRLRTDFPNSTPPKGNGTETDIVWDFLSHQLKP
jgi:poly(3-hydroxybutyrate) depolymerase